MTLTGIVGRPDGAIVPLVNTTKRTKQIALTATGTNWTTVRAVAVFYADSVGIWRMAFNINGAFSPGVTSSTLTVAGVVFKASTQNQTGATIGGTSSPYHGVVQCLQNSSSIALYYATTATDIAIAGDVELNAEPTWTSLGTTYAQVAESPGDVAAYIPMAAAGVSGLLNYYAEGNWTPEIADAHTGGNTAAPGSSVGFYTRIGRLVTATCRIANISTTGLTAGNTLYVRGLPFMISAESLYRTVGSVMTSMVTFDGSPVAYPNPGTYSMYLQVSKTAAANVTIPVSAYSHGSALIIASISYQV